MKILFANLQAIAAPWLLYLIVRLSKYFGYEASPEKLNMCFMYVFCGQFFFPITNNINNKKMEK
ncbi:putative membrane protein [Collimonas arenae]|nr:putative membrane protein [Collimonas arenae]